MKNKKLGIGLIIALSLQYHIITAQSTCIQGDCKNGAGKAILPSKDTLITTFKNGKPSQEIIIANAPHTEFLLARVDSNSYYYRKTKEFDLVAYGKYSNENLIDDTRRKESYVLLKNGNFEYTTNEGTLLINQSFNAIQGLATTDNNKDPRFQREFKSNGKDFRYLQFKDSVLLVGMIYIAEEDKSIYFRVKNDQLSFQNIGDKVLFDQVNETIDKGLKIDYAGIKSKMKSLDKSRRIEELYLNFWPGLQRKELKPLITLMEKMAEESIQMNNVVKSLN